MRPVEADIQTSGWVSKGSLVKGLKNKLELLASKILISIQNAMLNLTRFFLFQKTTESLKSAKSILVFRSSGLGDFVCFLPALHLLRKHHPKAKIVLLTTPSANPRWRDKIIPGGMFLANHLVDEKLLIPGDKLKDIETVKRIRHSIKLYDPDLCIIFPFSGERFLGRLKKLIYLRILGLNKNVYGVKMESTLSFFRKAQFAAGKFKHQITAAISSLKEVGIQDQEVAFDINITPEDTVIVDSWWKENKFVDHKVVSIHPGSNQNVKRWPIENFELLGKGILELNPQTRLLVIGGKEDEDLGNLLVESWGRSGMNFAGKSSVLQTAEILRRCILFVGNDSFPMHLSSALGIPTIGIFSSREFPVFWKPWGESSKVIRHSVPCEFCFTKDDSDCPTRTYECIKNITIEEVFNSCLPYLR
jgi:ADP-heptose:LPS heptosyltransferase